MSLPMTGRPVPTNPCPYCCKDIKGNLRQHIKNCKSR